MEQKKLAIKFDKPPVHYTSSGSLFINPEDILHSKVGQEVILRMATMEPLPKHPAGGPTGRGNGSRRS
ncbi:MAG: hypothetical protein ACREQW_16580 [Candidatus Binatia bacterium]